MRPSSYGHEAIELHAPTASYFRRAPLGSDCQSKRRSFHLRCGLGGSGIWALSVSVSWARFEQGPVWSSAANPLTLGRVPVAQPLDELPA